MIDLIKKRYDQKQIYTIEESAHNKVEKEFIKSLCNLIVEALRLPYETKQLVANILHTAIEKQLTDLLISYKEFYYEDIAHILQNHFSVPNTLHVQPDWNFGDHAKLDTVLKVIDEWLSKADEDKEIQDG